MFSLLFTVDVRFKWLVSVFIAALEINQNAVELDKQVVVKTLLHQPTRSRRSLSCGVNQEERGSISGTSCRQPLPAEKLYFHILSLVVKTGSVEVIAVQICATWCARRSPSALDPTCMQTVIVEQKEGHTLD